MDTGISLAMEPVPPNKIELFIIDNSIKNQNEYCISIQFI